MPVVQPQVSTAPFDAVAARYDEIFTSSRIGQEQRASVWRELAGTFHAGDRVLEVGCGTGVDACFLAERGVRVVASDSSAQMIAVAGRRIQKSGLQNLVRPALLRAEDIATLPAGELFDGAFSNFGVVNCIRDLESLARALHRLLRPRAKILLCCLGPFCLWEIVWHLAHGEPRKAFRRLRPGNTARIADGVPLDVYYPTIRSLTRAFEPGFRRKSLKGVGILVPPSYVEHWAGRFPSLLRVAVAADSRLARCPGLRLLADHVLLELERSAT